MCALALLATTSLIPAAEASATSLHADPGVRARAAALIELHAFAALPAEHQRTLAEAGLAPGAPLCEPACTPAPWAALARLGEAEYADVRRVISRELWDRIAPVHQHALRDMVHRRAAGEEVPMMCFAPGTEPELVDAFNRVAAGGFGLRFQQAQRWSATATQPGPLQQGDPTTLTYSFPPDGTICPTLTTGTNQPSNLFAFLNGIYGTPAAWQAIYAQVFTRWGEVCNLTFVLEPNDDGAQIGTVAGQLGVRGDMRLSGTGLDGPSGVLAFNYFPNNGDMVIDTADTFYNTTTSNSLRLRNVLAHEHGHGLGMAHVCPSVQTKLMEPFISVAYDGPQFDDVLNGQRHYGDTNEPNDSTATATVLAAAGAAQQTVANVSCDDNSDVDVYRVALPAGGLFRVTVRPIGATYTEGPQTNPCTGGSPFDALRVNDLVVTVLAADGVTVLDSAAGNPVGVAESAFVVASGAQDVFIRVSAGDVNSIQAYELDYRLQPAPALAVVVPTPPPTVLDPNSATTFQVRIINAGDTLVPGSAQVLFRANTSLPFTPAPLTPVSGQLYQARLPAMGCGGSPQFYVQAAGLSSGNQTQPATAPASVFSATASTTTFLVRHDFETDAGWTAGAPGDTATSGIWVRADPNGTAAQPEDDFDADGTQCWFTGQAAPGAGAGDNDVDGGRTTLVSPVFDLSNVPGGRPIMTYARWYSNSAGAGAAADVFTVESSTNGGASWATFDTVGPSGAGTTGGWVNIEVDLATRVVLNNQVRFRFIADDAGPGSLIEAAIDAFTIRYTSCREACRGDFNGDDLHTVQDIFGFLTAYFSTSLDADVTGDGSLSVEDIFKFLEGWYGPCP